MGFGRQELIAERFRVLRPIAAGAVGIVYLCRDEERGDRAAIKTLRPIFSARPKLLKRFAREAEAVRALDHPHIVRYRAHGVDEQQRPYLVTDYVLGRPGSDLLSWRPELPLDAVVRLFGQLCDALEVVHAAGIVHRDLKWSNLIVRGSTPSDLDLTLIDFGVLRWAVDGDRDGSSLTKSGEIVGTALYCSPEQVAGMDIDARTDVYALGAMCYEVLAGRPPFVGESVRDVLVSHLRETPETPSSWPSSRAQVPAVLEAAVMKALEKDPDARFASAAAFRRALESAFPASMREWLRR